MNSNDAFSLASSCGRRSGHSLVVVGRKAIVFGGCADANDAPGSPRVVRVFLSRAHFSCTEQRDVKCACFEAGETLRGIGLRIH